MDKEIMENRVVYDKKKEAGELIPDFWVVIAQGKLLIQTQDHQTALRKIIEEKATNCFFAKVGTSIFF